jgi:hypothetical protein
VQAQGIQREFNLLVGGLCRHSYCGLWVLSERLRRRWTGNRIFYSFFRRFGRLLKAYTSFYNFSWEFWSLCAFVLEVNEWILWGLYGLNFDSVFNVRPNAILRFLDSEVQSGWTLTDSLDCSYVCYIDLLLYYNTPI